MATAYEKAIDTNPALTELKNREVGLFQKKTPKFGGWI